MISTDQSDNVYPNLILISRQPLTAALQTITTHCLQKIAISQTLLVTKPDCPEAVHEYRVNIRQLRSFLFFIKPLLQPESYPQIQSALRQLAQEFGYVREIDALLESWLSFSSSHSGVLGASTVLADILQTQRQQEVIAPLENLPSETVRAALVRAEGLIVAAIVQNDQCLGKHLEDFAACRFRKQVVKINRGLAECDFRDRSQVHPLRIRIKKLRYALTLLEPILKAKYRRIIPQLKELQQKLGQICDAPRNMAILQELALKHNHPSLWYESGILVGFQLRSWEVLAEELPGYKLVKG